MVRPLRIEVEGGWYHVISRGIERREIFRDDSNRRDFLNRLFGLIESHGLLVHGYCLMGNHFHLRVQTPTGNLKVHGPLQETYRKLRSFLYLLNVET